jgi:hypothetical protein
VHGARQLGLEEVMGRGEVVAGSEEDRERNKRRGIESAVHLLDLSCAGSGSEEEEAHGSHRSQRETRTQSRK